MKDYLGWENSRNKQHAQLYSRIMQLAFGKCNVLIGHHLTFEFGDDLSTENEIPSADTLMFDHEAMTKVFGVDAPLVMRQLASVPAEQRDQLLSEHLDMELERRKVA
jgi:hypothetical protein